MKDKEQIIKDFIGSIKSVDDRDRILSELKKIEATFPEPVVLKTPPSLQPPYPL